MEESIMEEKLMAIRLEESWIGRLKKVCKTKGISMRSWLRNTIKEEENNLEQRKIKEEMDKIFEIVD